MLTSLFSTMISFILIYCLHFTHIVSAYDFNAFQIKYGLYTSYNQKYRFCIWVLVAARSLCLANCPPKSVLESNYVSVILELAIYLYASMFIFGVYFKI